MSIVKHKNGRYSVYSGIVDNFTSINITKEEYIEIRKKDLERDLMLEVEGLFDRIDKHPELYTMGDKLKLIECLHGKEEREKVEKFLPKE